MSSVWNGIGEMRVPLLGWGSAQFRPEGEKKGLDQIYFGLLLRLCVKWKIWNTPEPFDGFIQNYVFNYYYITISVPTERAELLIGCQTNSRGRSSTFCSHLPAVLRWISADLSGSAWIYYPIILNPEQTVRLYFCIYRFQIGVCLLAEFLR